MRKSERIFVFVFFISLAVLLFCLGISITGYFIQTMYCEQGTCKEFCRFNSDCSADEICCDKIDFGVCEDTSICEKEYIFEPEPELDIDELPAMEKPTPLKNNILIYSSMTLIIIVLGIIYFFERKKSK